MTLMTTPMLQKGHHSLSFLQSDLEMINGILIPFSEIINNNMVYMREPRQTFNKGKEEILYYYGYD